MGIPVSVATDGCASNDLLDMWEEMRAAVLMARLVQKDANALSPREAFSMATVEAARAARTLAGELQPGKLADVIIVDLKSAHLQPFHDVDPFNMLVFCTKASDVRDTIINGELIMHDRHICKVNETDLQNEMIELDAQLYMIRSAYLQAA
jgi:5-methylthioadenosine/S-adenosylhomocysteine deaminase